MDYQKIIKENYEENVLLTKNSLEDLEDKILKISQIISEALSNGNTIFWCGNGGSASDSNHLSAEFVGRFAKYRKSLSSISLSSDATLITCIANDFGFENIYSRQLEGLGKEGDVLIAISTSGKSKNIINSLLEAKKRNIVSIALLGKDGGEALDIAKHPLLIPSNNTARIQEQHILIGHIICTLVERKLGLL